MVIHNQYESPWTEEELAILKEFWPKESRKVEARLPGRSYISIRHKASRLGLVSPKFAPLDTSKFTEDGLAWLAGYMQGDGSMHRDKIRHGDRHYEYTALSTTSIDEELADAVTPYGFHKIWNPHGGSNGVWQCKMSGPRAETLIGLMQPYQNGQLRWLPWAAGFFDAEGSIGRHHQKSRNSSWWRIQITNNRPELLWPYQKAYGGTVVFRDRGVHGKYYTYTAQSRQARQLAHDIEPFSKCNRKHEVLVRCMNNEKESIPR